MDDPAKEVSIDEFKKLVIREHDGSLVRLQDIADVILGSDNYDMEVHFSGNVQGTSEDGERSFQAPTVVWNVKTGEINGGPNVVLRIGTVEMTGDAKNAVTLGEAAGEQLLQKAGKNFLV